MTGSFPTVSEHVDGVDLGGSGYSAPGFGMAASSPVSNARRRLERPSLPTPRRSTKSLDPYPEYTCVNSMQRTEQRGIRTGFASAFFAGALISQMVAAHAVLEVDPQTIQNEARLPGGGPRSAPHRIPGDRSPSHGIGFASRRDPCRQRSSTACCGSLNSLLRLTAAHHNVLRPLPSEAMHGAQA